MDPYQKIKTPAAHAVVSYTAVFAVGVAGLFLVGFLLLVVLGARSYHLTAASQRENDALRTQLSYLSAIVKQNDMKDSISVQDDARYGTVLCLEDGWGYAVRVYRCGDNLIEDYAASGAPLEPEGGQTIGVTQTFCVSLQNGLLLVQLDEGEVVLQLRCQELTQ